MERRGATLARSTSESADGWRPTVSVVLITHNEGARLARTVHGILASVPIDAEIVVVDDRSTDGSTAFIDDSYPSIRLVTSRDRLGVARARNLGAASASGRALVFSDAHIDVTSGWLDHLMPVLEGPHVGAVAPAVSSIGDPAAKGFGLSLNDLSLVAHWLGWQGPEPYPVPMV